MAKENIKEITKEQAAQEIMSPEEVDMMKEFKNEISSIKNPYEHKNTSNKIVSKLKSINIDHLLKKKFHNIDLK